MTVTNDYAGPFDPGWSLDRLSRSALARLCRERMIVSMFHDRALMPHVAMAVGQEATIRQADSEWMGSSPVYTARNKANLAITGDGADAALKSFQFDIGAPHHFLDFRFAYVDHDLGFFWLPFCGAHDYLRQITKNDPHLVTNMCHHMEDRTFDATLAVTNPRLRGALAIEGDDMAAVAKLLQLDPFLVEDYVDYRVEVHDELSGAIEFVGGPGLDDNVCRSPMDWLDGFRFTAEAVNPRCAVTQVDDRRWELRIDPDAETAQPHWLSNMTDGGALRDFDLTERRVQIR